MKIYKRGIEKTWADSGVHTDVSEYVEANPGETLQQIATALSFSKEQVSWAIRTESLLAMQEIGAELGYGN